MRQSQKQSTRHQSRGGGNGSPSGHKVRLTEYSPRHIPAGEGIISVCRTTHPSGRNDWFQRAGLLSAGVTTAGDRCSVELSRKGKKKGGYKAAPGCLPGIGFRCLSTRTWEDFIQALQSRLGKLDFHCAQCTGQLFNCTRPNNRCRDPGVEQQPGNRHIRR